MDFMHILGYAEHATANIPAIYGAEKEVPLIITFCPTLEKEDILSSPALFCLSVEPTTSPQRYRNARDCYRCKWKTSGWINI
jgi:hypothetical protein